MRFFGDFPMNKRLQRLRQDSRSSTVLKSAAELVMSIILITVFFFLLC